MNANGKREGSSESSLGTWKGERRSTRLGFQDPFEVERPAKRARTEESITSVGSGDASSTVSGQVNGNGMSKIKVKTTGAAALRPNEIALEQVAGKKKSKFWVYAVEPIPEPEPEGGASEGENVGVRMNGDGSSHSGNGHETVNGQGVPLSVDQVDQGVAVGSTP